jgi:2-isopropylmalate synthase
MQPLLLLVRLDDLALKQADDVLLRALQDSRAAAVTLVAKSHDRHVDLALKTHLDENLAMIKDSIEFLRAGGQRVFLRC